jgi:hypothetical protein
LTLLPRLATARLLAWLLLALFIALPARAQGIELTSLALQKLDAGLTLDFTARVQLPHAVEDAVQRGVPVYFIAEANVYRHRWYWRDQRVARASRSWRLSYQPLSDTWRVSLGGLAQTHGTLPDALAAMSGAARWKIADHSQIDPDERYYVEFSYKLDTTQLPRPMQFGIGGQADWSLGVERILKVE